MRNQIIIRVFVLTLFLSLLNSANAQISHGKLKAVFIYQFANNITWKNTKELNNFTILIYGDDTETYNSLKKISEGNKLKEKAIVLKQINTFSDINQGQVLYVSKEKALEIEEIWSHIERKNILLISEECTDLKHIMLNLQYEVEDEKYSFQINKANIIIENLIVEPELLLLGGTEVDVRELYREMKNQLVDEKKHVDVQRDTIEKQLNEIKSYQKGIDSLQLNSDNLYRQINSSENTLSNLIDSIQSNQSVLEKRLLYIKKQENEIENRGLLINEQESKIQLHLNQLDSLTTAVNNKENLIKTQGESLLLQESEIELKNKISILLIILVLIILLFGLYMFREYQIKKQLSATLEEKVCERTAELLLANKNLKKEISVRVFIEDELKKSEKNYSEIFNATTETIFIHDPQTGEIIDANDSLESMFGYSTYELGVINLDDISSVEDGFNQEQGNKLIKKAIEEGPQLFEWRSKRKNGDLFWSEVALKNCKIGDADKVLAVIRDITEKKKVERELDKYRNNLEQIVQERTDELSTTNEELNAINEELFLTNEKLNAQKEELVTTLNKLKEAQTQIVQSEKMASLGILTAGIAHEINNPVNFINAGTYGLNNFINGFNKIYDLIMELSNEVTPKSREKLNEMIESLDFDFIRQEVISTVENISVGAERIAGIVKGLRTFSHKDNNTKQLIDINENLDITLAMLHHETKYRIEVIRDYGEIPKVLCYAGQINQVFMNMLVNAIQAIKDKGTIIVESRVSKDNKNIEISIKDNGIGFSKETENNIFEPFFTTKEVGKGTGLGLYISYNIIKEHNGNIIVNSIPDKGSDFIINLPLQ